MELLTINELRTMLRPFSEVFVHGVTVLLDTDQVSHY